MNLISRNFKSKILQLIRLSDLEGRACGNYRSGLSFSELCLNFGFKGFGPIAFLSRQYLKAALRQLQDERSLYYSWMMNRYIIANVCDLCGDKDCDDDHK